MIDTTTESLEEEDNSSESQGDETETDTTPENVGVVGKPSGDNNKEDTVKPENYKKQDYVLAEYYENFKTHGKTSKTVYGFLAAEALGAELEESVPKLINLVRTTYGKEIPIVWVHGMMGEGSWSYISDIIESEYQGKKGGIYSLQIAKHIRRSRTS